MDCHSPGQGLMPASFKVRTVPLDGDDSATEELLAIRNSWVDTNPTHYS